MFLKSSFIYVLGVISIFTTEKVWIYGVAALVLLNTAVYFVSGLLEKKGKLLHSLVALLATAAFSLVTVIISAIAGCGLIQSARVFAVCAVFVLLLCVIRRKRAGAQLRAFFSL